MEFFISCKISAASYVSRVCTKGPYKAQERSTEVRRTSQLDVLDKYHVLDQILESFTIDDTTINASIPSTTTLQSVGHLVVSFLSSRVRQKILPTSMQAN
jgi:hypothetical protein